MEKSLFVGNLPYTVGEELLLNHFAPYGATSARVIEGKGFGFVTIPGEKIDEIIAATDGSNLGGRNIRVNEATPRPPRSFDGGGGGGGGRSGGGGGGYGGGGYGGGGGGGRSGGGGYGGGGGGGRSGGGRGGGGRGGGGGGGRDRY